MAWSSSPSLVPLRQSLAILPSCADNPAGPGDDVLLTIGFIAPAAG
jgi:hypothetical protein